MKAKKAKILTVDKWIIVFKTLHGLNIHKGHKHKEDQLPETICTEPLCTEISFPSEDKTEYIIVKSTVVSIQII